MALKSSLGIAKTRYLRNTPWLGNYLAKFSWVGTTRGCHHSFTFCREHEIFHQNKILNKIIINRTLYKTIQGLILQFRY
jgi:hypothetical protein